MRFIFVSLLVAIASISSSHAQLLRGKNASYADALYYEKEGKFRDAADGYLETYARDNRGKYPNALGDFFRCANSYCKLAIKASKERYVASGNLSELYTTIDELINYVNEYNGYMKEAGLEGNVGNEADLPGFQSYIDKEGCALGNREYDSAKRYFGKAAYQDAYSFLDDAQQLCLQLRNDPRLGQMKAECITKGQKKLVVMPMTVSDPSQTGFERVSDAVIDSILGYNDPFYKVYSRTELENLLFQNNFAIEEVMNLDINKAAALGKALNMQYILLIKIVSASIPAAQTTKKEASAYLIEKYKAEVDGGEQGTFYRAQKPITYSVINGKRTSSLKIEVKLIDATKRQILHSGLLDGVFNETIKYVDTGGRKISDLSNIEYDMDVSDVRMPIAAGIVKFQNALVEINTQRELIDSEVVQQKLVGYVAGRIINEVIAKKL